MAALAAPNGVFEHAGDSESNRSAFSQLVQSLSALPDLQDLLTNQSLPPRDLAAQLRAADGMLREMSGIVGKANEGKLVWPGRIKHLGPDRLAADLFALDPSTSTDASAPLPPLPDILLQPNKRQRTRQAPSLPGNPSLAVQPQARPRPRLIPASARQRRVLSRSEISAVLESASDQAGSSGCAISSEGIEELDVGLCKGSLTLEIGNLAKGTCHFGPRTTADGQRCTVVYRVTLGAVSEKVSREERSKRLYQTRSCLQQYQLGPHQSSRFKSFQDLSVHLTGLELDVVQFVVRLVQVNVVESALTTPRYHRSASPYTPISRKKHASTVPSCCEAGCCP